MANSRLNSVGGSISVSVWDLTWLDRDKEIEINLWSLFYIKLHPQFFLLHIWFASYYEIFELL